MQQSPVGEGAGLVRLSFKFVLEGNITVFLRLGLEKIDLYLMHSPIGGKIVESWDAMIQLQQQKLVRSIGVSNFSDVHLKELEAARPGNIPVGMVPSNTCLYTVCVCMCVTGCSEPD